MIALVLALLLGHASSDGVDKRVKTGPQDGSAPVSVVQLARQALAQPLAQRMKAVSDPFVGFPYILDAAGEGAGHDLDPPSRYDGFDCLTFIEEVLGLALAGDPIGAAWVKNQLRYKDGVATYENRRHFMETEWVPDNVAHGWLEDVTAQYGETHVMTKKVTADTWKWWKGRKRFALTDERLPTGTIHMPLLSLDAAILAAESIEPGTLVLTVRQSRDYVPIVVTHIGFVLPKTDPADAKEIARMRHCTRMGDMRVRDERLAWYFEHLRDYDKWPVEGIQLLKPLERGPRIALVEKEPKVLVNAAP